MEWILMPLKRYADFSGRSRRKEFWIWYLFVMIMYFVLMYLDAALGLGGSATGYAQGGSVGFNMTGGLLTLLFMLAILVPNIAVAVRRMHDIGKSGWMVLIGLIPLFGWIYVLYLYVQPGQSGPNQYGPDPKGGGADAQVFS
ncbi:MAG TPA: DUF805 domain-containing protein [Allosphingosinicella sp.]|nr:DUF805 domain-containing protein [Allosphingosinicella sp.]